MIAYISAGQSSVGDIENDLKAVLIRTYGGVGGYPDYDGDPDNPTWEGVPQVLRDAFNAEIAGGKLVALCKQRAKYTMPEWNQETGSLADLPKVVVNWMPEVPGGQIVNDDPDDNRLDFPMGSGMQVQIVEYEGP